MPTQPAAGRIRCFDPCLSCSTHAAGQTPLRIELVVSTGRPDGSIEALGALPANVRAAGYLPYGFLLPKVALMITNGGYQGVQAALSFGVPLVTAGAGEDKPEVCARLRRTGAS